MAEIGNYRGCVMTPTPWKPLTVDRIGGDVAVTAREWNSPDHIHKFLERTSVGKVMTTDGDRLDFTVSDTPYSDRHLMLVLSSEKMIHRPQWNEGLIIHKCSPGDRQMYWLAVVESLSVIQGEADPGDLVMFSENTCCKVTDETDRLPRSIGLVHGHITRFREEDLQERLGYSSSPGGLEEERVQWGRISASFVTSLNRQISFHQPGAAEFKVRSDLLPHGYFAKIDVANLSNVEAARALSHLLKTHHETYAQIVQMENVTKPQPSYRTYVQLGEDNCLFVSISPVLTSHAGSVNAADIDLRRMQKPDMDMASRRYRDAKLFRPIVEAVKLQIR